MSGMKSSSKEINIINMSLLDILCGAMGAFCFMMLALFPYWSPSGVGAKESLAMSEQMQQEIERLKRELKETGGPGSAGAVERLEKLQGQMQQMEGQNNRLRAELDEEKKKVRDLEVRNPVIIAVDWSAPGTDIDIFAHSPTTTNVSGKSQPPVDPNAKQGHFFYGDVSYGMNRGPGMDFWLMRDTIQGSRLDIYYKYFASNGYAGPVKVYGTYINNSRATRLPFVEMAREKTAIKVGSLTVAADYSIRFDPVPELADAYRRQLQEASQPSGK
ncbi:MAG: hypothetical protein IT163_05500 [Bryobacterales bacterium]|nr:hypothetical protein [Bryobacterales bacterium]